MTKTDLPNIYQRIHSVMKDVTTIQKEDTRVNGQYTFVSHDEVTRVMHGALVNHGIVMIPSIESITQNGNKTEIIMEISFVNIDNPSDQRTVRYAGHGIDNQDKGVGKAISYAVKYALLKTFCLETTDDVERDSINHVPNEKETPTIGKEQLITLKELFKESDKHGHTEDFFYVAIQSKFGLGREDLNKLHIKQYNEVIDFIRTESEKQRILKAS